jgi:hypothetical protein
VIGVTGAFQIGAVKAFATDGQRSPEDWACIAASKIISVSDQAPQPIRDQAHAFQSRVQRVIQNYIEMALQEERAVMAAKMRNE